jgi:hypothetical protein
VKSGLPHVLAFSAEYDYGDFVVAQLAAWAIFGMFLPSRIIFGNPYGQCAYRANTGFITAA